MKKKEKEIQFNGIEILSNFIFSSCRSNPIPSNTSTNEYYLDGGKIYQIQ